MAHGFERSSRAVDCEVDWRVCHRALGMARQGKEHCQALWARATAVCFDVDSTVCVDEGIDKLAEHCGVGEAVAAWWATHPSKATGTHPHLRPRLDRPDTPLSCPSLCGRRTQRAMGGSVSFQEALQARLDIIRPSVAQVGQLLRAVQPTGLSLKGQTPAAFFCARRSTRLWRKGLG